MKKILLSLFLLACYSLGFATVTMQLESSQVQAGETFRLILTLEGAQTDSVPDLTPLQKDFTIVGTERSINYSLVNGRAQSVGQWLILLIPKKTGILPVPAIQVGAEKTTASSVEVTEQGTQSSKKEPEQQQDVKVLTEVSEENPFINQQVLYTVKLYYSKRLVNADYQPPQVEDALFIPLGTGRHYQTAESGRLYVVEEQQYAIFPQKSGRLKITPPAFSAIVYDVVPKQVNERAKPIFLDVKPISAQFTGKNWLPAKEVKLADNYDNNAASLQQGSTLIRTVTLQATAVPAQLLPALDFGSSPDFSIYPEKPSERNTFKQSDLVGTTTVKVTYLLNKAGQITIPALKLTWFNTTTGQEETASLPEHSIQVSASASGFKSSVQSADLPKKTQPSAIPSAIMEKQKTDKSSPELSAIPHVAWWVAGLFALAWLLTLGLWFWQKQTRQDLTQNPKQILKNLHDACLSNNASAARDTLMQWAHRQWPQANLLNLMDVENIVSDPLLKQQIKELSQALYHSNTQKLWQGHALWSAIISFKQGKTTTINKDNPLPPMHKL